MRDPPHVGEAGAGVTVAGDVAIGLGLTLITLIAFTVLLVVRARPPQPKRSRKMPAYYRTSGQLRAGLMRENRRRGRRPRGGR